jgi:hypothetical protein
MKALFYVLALLVAGAAGYFSLDVKNKFEVQKQEKLDALDKNKQVSKAGDDKDAELTEEKKKLDTAKKEKAEVEATIENLVAKEKTLRRDLGELEGKLEEQKATFANLENTRKQIEEAAGGAGVSLEELAPTILKMEEDLKAKRKQLGELEELVGAAEKAVSGNQSEIARLADRDAQRDSRFRRNAMESVVSAVNEDWGFVVIGAGSNTGFTPQTKLLVLRDGRRIAEVKPSAVEPSQTIAEIDPLTLSPGARIQPGDRVILADPATN